VKNSYFEIISGKEMKALLPNILEVCGYVNTKYNFDRENNLDYEEDKLNVIEENGNILFNFRN
jgi:hypothetical protein